MTQTNALLPKLVAKYAGGGASLHKIQRVDSCNKRHYQEADAKWFKTARYHGICWVVVAAR